MKEAPKPTNQMYVQLQTATGIEDSRSKWRVHLAMKEEEGEERRAMKAENGATESDEGGGNWPSLKQAQR